MFARVRHVAMHRIDSACQKQVDKYVLSSDICVKINCVKKN